MGFWSRVFSKAEPVPVPELKTVEVPEPYTGTVNLVHPRTMLIENGTKEGERWRPPRMFIKQDDSKAVDDAIARIVKLNPNDKHDIRCKGQFRALKRKYNVER